MFSDNFLVPFFFPFDEKFCGDFGIEKFSPLWGENCLHSCLSPQNKNDTKNLSLRCGIYQKLLSVVFCDGFGIIFVFQLLIFGPG